MKNICKRCGKEFEDKYKRVVCPECKIQKCIICGRGFEVKPGAPLAVCCSSKCRGQYAKITGMSKFRTQKARQTLKEKYGVENANAFQNEPRKCEYCGKEFVPNSARQKYCEGPHYGPCPICGKLVEIKEMSKGPSTCSEECRLKLAEKTSLERYGASNVFASEYGKAKIKQTMMDNYGVEHALQVKSIKMKQQSTMLQKYGVEHALQSAELKSHMNDTNLEKYGVEWVTQNEGVKQKIANTQQTKYGGMGLGSAEIRGKIEDAMVQRYGVSNPMQDEEIRDRAKCTNLERYGVDSPLQNPEILHKAQQTNLEKYGAVTSLLNEEVQSRARQTNIEKYGTDNIFKTDFGQELARAGVRSKFGVDNVSRLPETRAKIADTCRKRYGSNSWKSSPDGIQFAMQDPSKYGTYSAFVQDPQSFILNNFDHSPSIWELVECTGVTATTVGDKVREANCQHLVTYKKSTMEQEVVKYLKQLDPDLEMERCKRDLIRPYEVDIYLPQHRVAIECNPTYTHNSSFGTCWGDAPKSRTYHAMKTKLCESQGVQLIHIFGYEWNNHRSVVLSRLCNVIGRNQTIYYARKLEVKAVSVEDSKSFLNGNHLQGYTSSAIRIGLYDGTDLISLMTFSRPRGSLGHSTKYGEKTWELTRFCTKLYTNCVGAASRLFAHFIRQYSPNMVVSFSNVSNTRGKLYSILGFCKEGEVQPGYVWVSLRDDTYLSRVACQKQNLPTLFHEDIDIEHHTEKQIMEAHGYARVWNSGLLKWVWTPQNR